MWENSVVLENHPDIAFAGFHIIDFCIIEVKFSIFDTVETCNHMKKGRFPTS